MALPGRKGFRPICVDGQRYRWRVRSGKAGLLIVTVVRGEGAGERLEVTSLEWANPWLSLGGPAGIFQAFRPVTPALVAQAIREALRLGWMPERAGSTFRLCWERGVCLQATDRA